MTRFATLIAAICVLTIVAGLASPVSAQPYRHRMHVAYADMNPNYPACRIGWWQTVVYGHVRPHWGAWCR
jgi:hypothetical protein